MQQPWWRPRGGGGRAAERGLVRAARRAPLCMGGWEYRVEWEGGYGDTWEPALHLNATGAVARMATEARGGKVPTNFGDWVGDIADTWTHSDSRKARRARKRIRAKGGAVAGEWAEVLEMYQQYVRMARRWDGEGDNVGTEARRVRGEEWVVDAERTCYTGKSKVRKECKADGTEQETVGKGCSLAAHGGAEGIPVKAGEALRRLQMDREAMQAAKDAGETEYDSVLPDSFVRGVMDLEGVGVFTQRAGNAYEMMVDVEVAGDPVARVFARDLRLETSGREARSGEWIKMDRGNKAVLAGHAARIESGEAVRVVMDLHSEHGFTRAVATGSGWHQQAGAT